MTHHPLWSYRAINHIPHHSCALKHVAQAICCLANESSLSLPCYIALPLLIGYWMQNHPRELVRVVDLTAKMRRRWPTAGSCFMCSKCHSLPQRFPLSLGDDCDKGTTHRALS